MPLQYLVYGLPLCDGHIREGMIIGTVRYRQLERSPKTRFVKARESMPSVGRFEMCSGEPSLNRSNEFFQAK